MKKSLILFVVSTGCFAQSLSGPFTAPWNVVATTASLPSSGCVAGRGVFFVLAAPPGAQIYTNSGNGTCVWTPNGGGGGGGAVSSVFGRTGAVTAASGDYLASQVTNAVDSTGSYANPAFIASLAYSKITGAPPAITFQTGGVANISQMNLNLVAGANIAITNTSAGNVTISASGGGGGATIPATTNLISGDGTGNGANSGIAPANVIVSTSTYANPSWITSLAYAKLTGAPTIPTVVGGTCTNQVVTSISNSVVPTCSTVTSAYTNNSIAQTGVDISTSFQVTNTHLAVPLPVVQGGTGVSSPSLVAGANITISGTWPNQSIASTGGGGGGGAAPYVTNAGSPPQTILQATHLEGINPDVLCFTGSVSAGATTGTATPCGWSKNASGDVTINWVAPAVQSVRISSSSAGGGTGSVTSVATTGPITGGTITTTGTIACPTCVTSAAALTNNRMVFGGGLQALAVGDLTGDVTTSGGKATTIATVNANVGSCGDATHVSQVTLNAKGQATACTPVLITTGGIGTVTSVATSGPISGGTITGAGTISCPTCTTNASALTSGQIVVGGGGQATSVGNISGDATTSGGTSLTLATVNSNVGACGDSTHVSQITLNGKGLATACTPVSISVGSGTVTHVTGPLSASSIMAGNGGADAATPAVATTLNPGGDIATAGRINSAKAFDLLAAADPGGITGFSLIPNSSITPYRWMIPSADAAGFIRSDGAGTPGHLSIVNTVPVANGGTGVTTLTGIVKASGTSAFTAATSTDIGALGTLTNATSGNAATATNFAVVPSLCFSGFAPRGVFQNGDAAFCQAISGGGAVSSVGLSLPGIFSVTGSPVTTSGTLTATFTTQAVNTVFAGPSSGGAATPTFRNLALADLPSGIGTVTSVSGSSPITGTVTTIGTLSCPTCTVSGTSLTANQLLFGNSGQSLAPGDLTGDVTTAGARATTLATVNGGPGLCGDSSHICQVTTDGKGRVTSQSQISIGSGVTSFNTRTGAVTLTVTDITALGNLTNNTSGNAATAGALLLTPALCSTGFAPTGILQNGNATGCAAIGGGGGSITGSGTANKMTKFTASTVIGDSITTDNGTVMNTGGLIAANIDTNHAFCASNGTFASCGTLPSIGWNTSIPSGMWVGNNLPTGHPSGAFGEYHFNAANGNSLVYGANNELQLGASQSANGFVVVGTLSNFSTTAGGAGAGLYGEIQCNGCVTGGAGISSEAHMQTPPSNTEIYSETSQCGSAASGRVPTEVGQGHSCTNMLSITGFQTDFTSIITTTTTGGTTVSSTGNPFSSGMCHGGSGCTGATSILVGLWIVNDNTLNNRLPYVITGFTDSNHVTVNRFTSVQTNQVTYLGWNNTASNDLVNTVGFTQVGARVRENGTGEFGIAQQWIAGASAHPNKIQMINAPTGNTNAGMYNGIEFWRGALGPDLTMPMVSAVNGYQMAEIRSDMTTNGSYAQGFLDIYTDQGSTLVKNARFDVNGLNLSVIPTSAGGGGLYVCIDTAGQMYKKSSCP